MCLCVRTQACKVCEHDDRHTPPMTVSIAFVHLCVCVRAQARKACERDDSDTPPVPVTVRQLEAIIRISESLAKMSLQVCVMAWLCVCVRVCVHVWFVWCVSLCRFQCNSICAVNSMHAHTHTHT